MKRLLIFGLACSVGVFSSPRLVGALVAAGPEVSSTCVVLDSTCEAVDSSFVPTFLSERLSGNVVTIVCQGKTSNKPAKTTTCAGKKLGNPCTGSLINGAVFALQSPSAEDWTEVISKLGSVKVTCRVANGPTP